MSLPVFRAALELVDEYVTIGGGEPTLHPRFEQILMETVAAVPAGTVLIVTNGSVKTRALMLARLHRRGILKACLSVDEFHDQSLVSPEVSAAFHELGAIRNVQENAFGVTGAGAAETNGLAERRRSAWGPEEVSCCACDSTIVKPNGDVFVCGCVDSPKIGNVLRPKEFTRSMTYGCWTEQEASCRDD